MLNERKIKMFFKLHWIKLVIGVCSTVIVISVFIFLYLGLQEWPSVDAITRQRTLATFPFQF